MRNDDFFVLSYVDVRKSLLRRQGNVDINMRLPSYDSVVNKSQLDRCERKDDIAETSLWNFEFLAWNLLILVE